MIHTFYDYEVYCIFQWHLKPIFCIEDSAVQPEEKQLNYIGVVELQEAQVDPLEQGSHVPTCEKILFSAFDVGFHSANKKSIYNFFATK